MQNLFFVLRTSQTALFRTFLKHQCCYWCPLLRNLTFQNRVEEHLRHVKLFFRKRTKKIFLEEILVKFLLDEDKCVIQEAVCLCKDLGLGFNQLCIKEAENIFQVYLRNTLIKVVAGHIPVFLAHFYMSPCVTFLVSCQR